MQDLAKTNTGNDSVKLLSLSVVIAIEVLLSNLSEEERKHFAAVFHNIAFQIEAEPYANMSLLGMLFGRKPAAKVPLMGDKNV